MLAEKLAFDPRDPGEIGGNYFTHGVRTSLRPENINMLQSYIDHSLYSYLLLNFLTYKNKPQNDDSPYE